MIKQTYKKTKELVTKLDMFEYTRFLRYGQESGYKSANGGLCSLIILIVFIFILTNKLVSTMNMKEIISTTTLHEEADPSIFNTTTQGFVFAVGISNFNLVDPNTKYFDIQFSQEVAKPRQTITYTLVPCSRQIWTSVYPDIGDTFDRLNFQSWLCLPNNTNLTFQGKYTSNIFQYARIGVKACSPTVNDNRTCVNQSQIDSIITTGGPITFNYYFMNTIINANNHEYLKSYLEDRNYFTFTMNTGSIANIFISVYDIKSDVSLWPISNIVQNTGGMVYEATQNFAKAVNSGNPYYLLLYLRKSSLSISIQRSFYTYFDCLSYIGGLFGAIMTVLAFMSLYNESAYQIDVSSSVFKQTLKKKIKQGHFNILTYLAYLFYSIIHFFGANPEWKLLKQFDSARQQISKQLSIKLILKKIQFLQDCMEYLFEDFQLKCLHLKDKLTLDQAAKVRRKFFSRPLLLKLKKKYKQIQGKQQLQNNVIFGNLPDPQTQRALQYKNIFHNIFQLNVPQQMTDKKSINMSSNQKQRASSISLKRSKKKRRLAQYHDKQRNKDKQIDVKIEEQQLSDDNISSLDETEKKQFYQDILDSIYQLQEQASQGKSRCVKIFNNLDQVVKDVAGIYSKDQIKEINLQSKVKKIRSLDIFTQNKDLE